jgi:hypothetical protein
MKFEIIDNFLEKEDFDYIINTFFPKDPNNPNNFAWNYHPGIVRDPELGPTGYEEHDWMYNKLLFSSEDDLIKCDRHYHIVKPILKKLNIKKLYKVRTNLLVPTKEHIYHEFHTDWTTPHKVALFYVTDSNGWTVLKDTAKVKCIKNRILVFDGMIEHHSVSSTDEPRCVINFNYI